MVLDDLKDVWKNQKESSIQFSETDIYKMIHKKSSSIVKWIFYISIIEFVLLVILPNLFIDDKEEVERLGMQSFVTISIVVSVVIAFIFMFLFYKNYKQISVSDSTKKLMNNILKTKKTVSFYIIIQLIMSALAMIFTSYKLLNSEQMTDGIQLDSTVGVWVLIIFIIVFLVGVIWIFYRLLYGILINRLKENYKELKRNEG